VGQESHRRVEPTTDALPKSSTGPPPVRLWVPPARPAGEPPSELMKAVLADAGVAYPPLTNEQLLTSLAMTSEPEAHQLLGRSKDSGQSQAEESPMWAQGLGQAQEQQSSMWDVGSSQAQREQGPAAKPESDHLAQWKDPLGREPLELVGLRYPVDGQWQPRQRPSSPPNRTESGSWWWVGWALLAAALVAILVILAVIG